MRSSRRACSSTATLRVAISRFEVADIPLNADKRLRHRAEGGGLAVQLNSMMMRWTCGGTVHFHGRRLTMEPHEVVSRDEWLVARKALLAQEKEFTRLRDQLSADAARVTLGQGREAVRIRRTGRQANAR